MVVMIVSMAAMALALCHPRRCHCASTEFVEVTRFDAQMRMVTTPTRLSVVCYAPLWDMSLALYDILFARAGVAAARIPSCRPLNASKAKGRPGPRELEDLLLDQTPTGRWTHRYAHIAADTDWGCTTDG